jgi:hypothetical protein
MIDKDGGRFSRWLPRAEVVADDMFRYNGDGGGNLTLAKCSLLEVSGKTFVSRIDRVVIGRFVEVDIVKGRRRRDVHVDVNGIRL